MKGQSDFAALSGNVQRDMERGQPQRFAIRCPSSDLYCDY
jgi:hypothetical protein